MKNSILLLLVCNLVCSCANHPTQEEIVAPAPLKPTQTETLSIEAKQVAAEQKAEFVSELKFKPKQQKLSAMNKSLLDKMYQQAIQKGAIHEIKVISWSDLKLPPDHKRKLSAEQIALAEGRNQSIKAYFEEKNKDLKIKSYSMAQPTNAFKEFIGASEARIKKSLATTTGYSQASKSIVMIISE